MSSYIEKKIIRGRAYYYLTENKYADGKWKKTRKYLGVATPSGFEKPRRKAPKPILGKSDVNLVELIRKNYCKNHHLDSRLWKEERGRFVSFIFNTNAIEGNQATYEDTDTILRGGKARAREKDVREIKNMKKCVDFLFHYSGAVDERLLLKLHKIQMEGVLPGAGGYRTVDVRVGNYICPSHKDVPGLMSRFFQWFRESEKNRHPFELAVLAHLKFVRIHPFRDGNGRMARLLMNLILLKRGYPPLNIFNDEKLLYYLVLKKVDATRRPKPFVGYLLSTYVRQYEEYAKKA
ncbi:MAG: Fic family protein [Candidatus Micrarchaeota archaeon]|nr:Fic family protein [Candidatus Micrarchaeota archaeon]